MPLFKAHPLVNKVSFAEQMPERRRAAQEKHQLDQCYESFDELLQSDADAVCVFTQRWTHAPLVVKALRAGKHVLSSVPAAVSLVELEEIIDTVKETGQIYMLAETHYYHPSSVLCRKLFRQGAFGDFVYGQAGYLHDMEHGFYPPFQIANGDNWQRFASFPPMLYPTHSVGWILSVTGERMTRVSCFGQVDQHHDGIFDKALSAFDNNFSNQSGLFRHANGGMCRANEFRRVTGKDPLTIQGTTAAFAQQRFIRHDRTRIDMAKELTCAPQQKPKDWHEQQRQGAQEDFFAGAAPIHDTERLPKSFHGLSNGHNGSHHFLADDFVQAVHRGHTPVLNVWAAARFCAPGIIAHQSSLRDGETLDIPDFGTPPSHMTIMDLEQECGKALPVELTTGISAT